MGPDGGRCPTISIKWRCAAGRALEHSRTGLNSCLESPGWNLASSRRTEFFTRALAPHRGGVPRDKPAEHRIAGDLGGWSRVVRAIHGQIDGLLSSVLRSGDVVPLDQLMDAFYRRGEFADESPGGPGWIVR